MRRCVLVVRELRPRIATLAAFEGGGRPELAQAERAEIAIIREFMPKQMSPDEARAAAHSVIAELGASSVRDMGKVMAALKERYAGQMDFSSASGTVTELLSAK